jgi:hypothetical protein
MGYMVENDVKATVRTEVYGYVSTVLPHLIANKPFVPTKTYALKSLKPGNIELIRKSIDEVIDLVDYQYGGEDAIWYLLTELGNNIDNHSEFSKAFVMAQRYPRKGFTEFCAFDNGITIPGNFNKYGIDFENDSEAIALAMNGRSTKDELNGRGWGINSLIQLFTEGINGEMFIASRNGAIYINKEKIINYLARGKYKLDGTLVSIRIPKGSINVTNFLEVKNIIKDRRSSNGKYRE